MIEEQTTEQEQIISELENNTGTEQYFKIPFSSLVYTDGVNDLINRCKCHWLISDLGIGLHLRKQITDKPFLIIGIEVKNKKALITIKEDTNDPIIFKKNYSYTDFPLSKFEFYLINKVFLLKSEY